MGCSEIPAGPVLCPQFSCHGLFSHIGWASFRPSVQVSWCVQPYLLGQILDLCLDVMWCSAISAGPVKTIGLAVIGCKAIAAGPVLGPQFSCHGVFRHTSTSCASVGPQFSCHWLFSDNSCSWASLRPSV
jgi:hypothetical protein